MIRAEHKNGAKFFINGEEISISAEYEFLLAELEPNSPPNEGNPEALYFYTFIEPSGFKIVEQTEEPEEIY